MYRLLTCVALAVAVYSTSPAWASDTVGAVTNKTTITLQVLTCEGCAKKVAAELSEVPGVGSVKTDVKSKTATVIPKGNVTLSPLQLWEAVEKAGKTPVKLTGPSGTFTSKPKM